MKCATWCICGLLISSLPVCAQVLKVELTCVDEEATGYGTFQSHNQKVLSTPAGIFTTHLRSRNEAYTAQQWRLSRSADGGKSFVTVLEATHATNPAVVETDESHNLYLVRPDFADGNAYLYFFPAGGDDSKPRITPIPASAAGKYALVYDPTRRQLYYCAQNHTFHIIAPDGAVRKSYPILRQGRHAMMQYPSLVMDGDTLHLAWTSSLPDKYLYWDIHSARSRDGGITWQKMDGTPLTLPILADDTGPADRVSLDDEFEVHSWLSNFIVRQGKAHFLYAAQYPTWRQHYVRYDLATGGREIDIQPVFKGETIELLGLDGFFAAGADSLYAVGHTPDSRIGCLRSLDNGATWRDHAVSDSLPGLYAVSGARTVTDDGLIIGSCTVGAKSTESAHGARVFFFRIRARARDAR